MSTPSAVGQRDGAPCYVKRTKLRFRLGMGLRTTVYFDLHRETLLDRFCKYLGLATEFQTDDHAFDQHVYVAGDNIALHALLRQSSRARSAIREALDKDFYRISTDGNVLWLYKSANREPTSDERDLIARLRSALSSLEGRVHDTSDPFFAKAVVVESLTWSIFAYAAASVLEGILHPEDYYLNPQQLFIPGLIVGGILFVILFGLAAFLLKGSSRGHRILVEAALLLILALPIAGKQLLSDLNRFLDKSETVATRVVQELQVEEIRHRKPLLFMPRNEMRYFLVLAAAQDSLSRLPSRIQVTEAVYSVAGAGLEVEFHLGDGYFGFPWYREIVPKQYHDDHNP